MSSRNMLRPSIAILAAAALAATFAAPASAAPALKGTSVSVDAQSITEDQKQAEELLRIIDEIPESVLLQGDEATRQWISEHLVQGTGIEGVASAAGFLECSGAILLAIGTTAIPVAKILKIKKLMNSLGGVNEAIRIMWGASFSYEKLQALGGAAAALGAELLGIAAIKTGCT
ncbi:hypothetical protein [Glutamicibacter sp. BW77]|uniref:Secreted protein n=1 Tax=Glutamicibacter bergerei TaxID=256702 RepID=A0ABV9MKN2_9MICC|nr:hypothetical protein [Glutamicibacter sp. BW77]